MEKEVLKMIRANLAYGDISAIARDCGVSQQKVSKILCGKVLNPDENVLEAALIKAQEYILRKSAFRKTITKLSKDERTINATAVGESSTR